MTDISHIGIAVKDLSKAVTLFAAILGRNAEETVDVPEQKVRVAMFSSGDASAPGRIELLEATSDDSPIKKFIDKRGEGLHHLAVLVDDIELKLDELKQAGFRLIDETPRVGAEGKKIAFVHPASTGGVLLELQER
jgi:methylmalonyl-CoA/ethylmalonyl-CoA epimerase